MNLGVPTRLSIYCLGQYPEAHNPAKAATPHHRSTNLVKFVRHFGNRDDDEDDDNSQRLPYTLT